MLKSMPYLAYLLASALVTSSRDLGTFSVWIVGVEVLAVFAQAHGDVRHLLRRMCRSLLRLEVRMRALQRSHWRWLLILVLLWAG